MNTKRDTTLDSRRAAIGATLSGAVLPARPDSPSRRLAVRLLEASDGALIEAFYRGLSAETLYRRFHTPTREVRPQLLQLLLGMDGRDHLALGAFRGPALVGEARYVRLPEDGTTAEIAATVADGAQGQGVGKRLLRALALRARAGGVAHFLYTVQADNEAATALFARRGQHLSTAYDQRTGVIEVDRLLAAAPETAPGARATA